jgi:hypothetical protein
MRAAVDGERIGRETQDRDAGSQSQSGHEDARGVEDGDGAHLGVDVDKVSRILLEVGDGALNLGGVHVEGEEKGRGITKGRRMNGISSGTERERERDR